MKKLHELLALNKPLEGDVGIEIECEGKKFREINNVLWKSEDDGSLRGRYPETRVEYILQKPIPVETVKHAVDELNAVIKGAEPSFSFRTSVHVHTNVQNMTEDQILSFIYTYLLLEEPLFNFCGNGRKANRFCLRVQDCDGIVSDVLNPIFLEGIKRALKFDENQIRYAAINIASMKKYGSIEFRGMRGTLDSDVLDIWCKALISIRNFACHFKNVQEVHDEYVKRGSERFIEYVLNDLSVHFKYKNMVKDMQRSYSLSIDLPYNYGRKKELREEKVAKVNIDGVHANAAFVDWDNVREEIENLRPVMPAFNANEVNRVQRFADVARIRENVIIPAPQVWENDEIGGVPDRIDELLEE